MPEGVFLAAIGNETPPRWCTLSIDRLELPAGSRRFEVYDTLGHVARQRAMEVFYKDTDLLWLFLVDTDMELAPDTIARMLATASARKFTILHGLAVRRETNPPFPAYYADDPAYRWPMTPLFTIPSQTEPFPVGAGGFACTLIHRQVLSDLLPMLKGEQWVSIDDMCLWPYDHRNVVAALEAGDIETLRAELKPLSMNKYLKGGDLRFSYFARRAGHPVWVDPTIRPKHYGLFGVDQNYYEKARGDIVNAPWYLKVWESRMDQGEPIEGELDEWVKFHEAMLAAIRQKMAAIEAEEAALRAQFEARLAEYRAQMGADKLQADLIGHKAALEQVRALVERKLPKKDAPA